MQQALRLILSGLLAQRDVQLDAPRNARHPRVARKLTLR
jgi:hypothetical protein